MLADCDRFWSIVRKCDLEVVLSGLSYFPFLSWAWVSAEAATLFSALVDLGLLKILHALLATREDVCSFLDFPIIAPWKNSLVLILLFSKPAAGAKL